MKGKGCSCKGECKCKKGKSCGCGHPRVSENTEKYLPKGEKRSFSMDERMRASKKKKLGL